jgi:hypothetical protein
MHSKYNSVSVCVCVITLVHVPALLQSLSCIDQKAQDGTTTCKSRPTQTYYPVILDGSAAADGISGVASGTWDAIAAEDEEVGTSVSTHDLLECTSECQ